MHLTQIGNLRFKVLDQLHQLLSWQLSALILESIPEIWFYEKQEHILWMWNSQAQIFHQYDEEFKRIWYVKYLNGVLLGDGFFLSGDNDGVVG